MATDQPAASSAPEGSAFRTPPYISFQTLLTFLKALKTDGLPPQIDKSVLSKLSGGVQGQLKIALRSLGLMGDGDKPTDELALMVEAFETPDFEPLLLERLKATYPYVFALDLMTATPTMFADAFKVTGAKEDVLRKCRTFFLHAAKRAAVQMGPRLQTGSVPRAPSNGSGRRKARAGKMKDEGVEGEAGQSSAGSAAKTPPASFQDRLLDKFPTFDPTWDAELQKAWFAGFQQFMAEAKKAK
jgi:hypothetical protein